MAVSKTSKSKAKAPKGKGFVKATKGTLPPWLMKGATKGKGK